MLRSIIQGTVLVVEFTNSTILDQQAVESTGQELNKIVDRSEVRNILINLDRITMISSAMIGQFLLFNKKCKNERINVKLCGMNKEITKLFKITKLNKLFPTYANSTKAIKAFAKEG